MNAQIEKLYYIAQKSERYIIGLMSGTSLDGLDIALCRLSGHGTHTQLQLEAFTTKDFTPAFRNRIRKIFAQRNIDQQEFSGLHALIGQTHGHLILEALADWKIDPRDIDLIASHGQTVYHAPQSLTHDLSLPNSTLQIGDADHIAYHTGIITMADFRQKHIAAGGEGAPLAAYGDYLLFSDPQEHRFLLNIGGISNYTYLPATASSKKAYASDLGPGNTLMNQYMHQQYGLEMDRDAALARKGRCHPALLKELLDHPFLKAALPKTTGPELFNLSYLTDAQAKSNTTALAQEDIMATLASFTTQVIIAGILQEAEGLAQVSVYISGGGLHNPLLWQQLQSGMPAFNVASFASLGLDPDAKEACLFAVLANESLVGDPQNVSTLQDSPAVCMGKISLAH